MSTTKRRRNKTAEERILEAARAKMIAAAEKCRESESISRECGYWTGVVDTLEHTLGIREVFKVEAKRSVAYEVAVE